jgi:hypothetical protein
MSTFICKYGCLAKNEANCFVKCEDKTKCTLPDYVEEFGSMYKTTSKPFFKSREEFERVRDELYEKAKHEMKKIQRKRDKGEASKAAKQIRY